MTGAGREKLRTVGSLAPWLLVLAALGWMTYTQSQYNVIASTHRHQLAEYLNSIENLDGARVVTDEEGKIREWNDGMEEIFGYSAGEVIGRRVEFLLPPDLQRIHSTAMGRSLSNPVYGRVSEIDCPRAVRKDGTFVHVQIRARFERRDGRPVAIAVFSLAKNVERISLSQAWSELCDDG